jgi:hypothetical protein
MYVETVASDVQKCKRNPPKLLRCKLLIQFRVVARFPLARVSQCTDQHTKGNPTTR